MALNRERTVQGADGVRGEHQEGLARLRLPGAARVSRAAQRALRPAPAARPALPHHQRPARRLRAHPQLHGHSHRIALCIALVLFDHSSLALFRFWISSTCTRVFICMVAGDATIPEQDGRGARRHPARAGRLAARQSTPSEQLTRRNIA